MKNPYFITALLMVGIVAASWSQDSLSTLPDTALAFPARLSDSLAAPGVPAAGVAKADSTAAPLKTPSEKPNQPPPETLKLVKRSYNGRQQILLATGMMIFVVAIMTAAQQWNPR
jgi:hypothetical protein